MENNLNCNVPIIAGFLEIEEENIFQVYLINLSNVHYSRVVKKTGSSYEGMNSAIIQRELNSFPPNSALLIDQSDLGELDFNIWYLFDLYESENELLKISLSISWHIVYQNILTEIPIINKSGRILKLQKR